jgi:hypothetical protein
MSRSRSVRSRVTIATLCPLLAACKEDEVLPGETPDAGTQDAGTQDAGSGFMASGTLTPGPGRQVPSSAKVFVVWLVSSGSPDYGYKFGEGVSSGATFSLNLQAPPPVDALNAGELGVGLMTLVTSESSLADGKYEGGTGDPSAALGAAGQYALIYKAKATVTYTTWADRFPVGYSCGKGVKAQQGFDSFEPVPCNSIGITVDLSENIEFVNWT